MSKWYDIFRKEFRVVERELIEWYFDIGGCYNWYFLIMILYDISIMFEKNNKFYGKYWQS